MALTGARSVLSTILRYDSKVTSYKIALLRAINDLVLGYPDALRGRQSIAVPLRILASYWVAYYWPFVDAAAPIFQGPRAQRNGRLTNDISFRPALATLLQTWMSIIGSTRPADGFFLINELRLARSRNAYPPQLLQAYSTALSAIVDALQQPIRYAGPKGEQWTVFARPTPYRAADGSIALPSTRAGELCLVLSADLWMTFRDMSLWVEALCIHEWCLFTERVDQGTGGTVSRGMVYQLLTDRPDNRRPLTWERNRVDLLLLEGRSFTCPWTGAVIRQGQPYDLDHVVPVSLYPINELWNLVPAEPHFNQHNKRDRLPSLERLTRAQPHLAHTYTEYASSPDLAQALTADVQTRFATIETGEHDFPEAAASAVTHYVDQLATLRNLVRF